MENNLSPTQVCSLCQESKPFPAHFIASYNTMEKTSQCKDCRNAKRKNQRKNQLGNTDKANSWKNSMTKIFKF